MLIEAIHFIFILTSWYFLSVCNILPGIAVIHHLLYRFTLLKKWVLSAARLSMLCSQCCLLSTCFHHSAWQTQSTPKPGHTAHLGQPALSTSHCPALLQGPEQGGGWCLGMANQHEHTFWDPQRGKDFLNEWHGSSLRLSQAVGQCDMLNFAQLCAVSPSALPWSLHPQIGVIRSFFAPQF